MAKTPVSSSHGSGRAGGDRALLHLPPPSPAGINAAAEGCFPPLLQQPTSNRLLGATAQAPARGANNARQRAQTDGVTTARPGAGAEPGCCQDFLASFLSAFSPTPKRLTPNPEFRHARQTGLQRERRSGERLRRRQPLIGSKGVHSLSPARPEPAQPIGVRTDRNDPILELG